MTAEAEALLARFRARLMPHGKLNPSLYGVVGDSAYYVPAQLFRDACGGIRPREAARMLASLGVLQKNQTGGFKHRKALPDSRKTARVYVLHAEPLGLPPSPAASGDWHRP
ncbi:hypothetical protein [Rhodanobacter sp. UC4436_H3]